MPPNPGALWGVCDQSCDHEDGLRRVTLCRRRIGWVEPILELLPLGLGSLGLAGRSGFVCDLGVNDSGLVLPIRAVQCRSNLLNRRIHRSLRHDDGNGASMDSRPLRGGPRLANDVPRCGLDVAGPLRVWGGAQVNVERHSILSRLPYNLGVLDGDRCPLQHGVPTLRQSRLRRPPLTPRFAVGPCDPAPTCRPTRPPSSAPRGLRRGTVTAPCSPRGRQAPRPGDDCPALGRTAPGRLLGRPLTGATRVC